MRASPVFAVLPLFPGIQKTLFAGLLLLTLALPAHAVGNITVDANQVKFTRTGNATGLLVSFLLDFANPNPATPYTTAISQSGVGWLRFPEGGMSKNYLWHTPGDYTHAVNGLKPQVASLSTPPGTSPYSGYRLATNSPVFNNIPMNFDQFIKVCQDTGVEPIVTVSAQAYKYANTTVTMADLKTNAVECLRSYAAWNADDSTLAVWIVNKDANAGSANLTLSNFNQAGSYDKWVFTGDSPDSTNYTWQQVGSGLYSANPLAVILSPCSITVLHFHLQPPQFNRISLTGQTHVLLSGTGGLTNQPSSYRVLSATDLTLPVANWSVLTSGQFNSDGSFNIFAPRTPGIPQQFYRLAVP